MEQSLPVKNFLFMKTRLIFLLVLIISFFSCGDPDSDTATLELSESSFDKVNANGETLKINVTCNSTWKASSNQSWCIPNRQTADNDGELILTIHANNTTKARNATVTIVSKKVTKTIKISQTEATTTVEEYHYKLPVIFHVLYNNPNDRMQYVEKERLKQILQACNLIYQNKIYRNPNSNISQDMNLEFVMATEAPDGTALETPGIEYIEWSSPSMDCTEFMNGKNSQKAKEYAEMIWNPKLYINVFIYPFTEHNILGISHLPYAISKYPLSGLNNGDYYLNNEVAYPHCVSINSTHIYKDSSTQYSVFDVYVTLAHELGHYLGLHHAFSEKGDNTDLCEDTDYCNDTPTYNIVEYTNWVNNLPRTQQYTLKYLSTRHNCSGVEFVSRNIMDYAYCFSDVLTSDQRKRIRHVLSYSPLIPGPKEYSSADTRSLASDEKPPIQFKY